MRYLLLIILLAGCTNPEPIPLPSKTIKVDNTRYFFIGFAIGNEQRGSITWVSQSGSFPLKKDLLDACRKSKKIASFNNSDFIILSLYEFKNKEECDAWDEANSEY
jgi:hypothetical protein